MVKLLKRVTRCARNIDDYAIAKVTRYAIDQALEAIINGANKIELTIQLGIGIRLTLPGDRDTFVKLEDARRNLPTDAKQLKNMLLDLVDNNDEVTVFTSLKLSFGVTAHVGISGTYPIHTLYCRFDEITGRKRRNGSIGNARRVTTT